MTSNIITGQADLLEICRKIDDSGRFAIDLEFIPERTYAAELCLVQVATDDQTWIVDPLALPDLMPLWQRIADPGILKVLHAADQDLELAVNASGLIPQNIMDTQVAAGFAGFGYPVGYGKLLQQMVNISLSKTESYTDWSNRPLSQQQIEYAIDDVQHLLPLYDKLAEKLNSMQRLEWVRQECLKYSAADYYEKDFSNECFRIKGANGLSRRGLAILRELALWRRKEADKNNRPLKSILQDGILVEFARKPPKELTDLQRIRGIRPDQLRMYGNGLLQAVRAGLSVSEADLPKWPTSRIPTRREVLMADVLYTVLRVTCFDLDIAPELVSTRSVLEALVRQHADSSMDNSQLPILKGWRFEMAGKSLLDILAGKELVLQFCEQSHPVKLTLDMENSAQ